LSSGSGGAIIACNPQLHHGYLPRAQPDINGWSWISAAVKVSMKNVDHRRSSDELDDPVQANTLLVVPDRASLHAD